MRVFLALRIPPAVLRLAGEVQACSIRCLPPAGRISPVPLPTNGHVTLVFLGEVSAEVTTELRARVTEALGTVALTNAPKLYAKRAVRAFGERHLVVYVPVKYDEALGRLQHALRIAARAVHPPVGRHRRRFQAHVTVARVTKLDRARIAEARRKLRDVDQALRATVAEEDLKVAFDADEVVLYESKQLESGGTVYEEVWAVPVVQEHITDLPTAGPSSAF